MVASWRTPAEGGGTGRSATSRSRSAYVRACRARPDRSSSLRGRQPAFRILLHEHVDEPLPLLMAHAQASRVSHLHMVRERPPDDVEMRVSVSGRARAGLDGP